MKTQTAFVRLFISAIATISLSGCWLMEDKGTTEVGTPVVGEADFDVDQPDTGGDGTEVPEVPQIEGPQNPGDDSFSFIIDNGAEYSHGTQLKLTFSVPLFSYIKYKVTHNNDCVGGVWEDFNESLEGEKLVSDFTANAKNTYSVQFRDVDNVATQCFSDSIIHDNKGPNILFTKYPASSLEEGATGEIIVEVTDISPIAEVTCSMNGISKTCFPGTNKIQLTQMPAGNYEFAVTAKDVHGYTASQKVNWSVVSKLRYLSQSVQVKQNKKVDVLVVIDNSKSMEYEQQSMASRVRNMLAILDGLDYRIAVTTTDPNPTRRSYGVTYYGDGDLIPIVNMNGALWVDSSVNQSVAQDNLGLTLQRAEQGSGSEQGIYATYRLIEKATTVGHAYSNFLRPDAAFSTLVITDEDESANGTKNNPESLLQLIGSKFNNQKAFSFHAIVTKPGDTVCKDGHGHTYGERYKTMVELTGGVLGSVCESDYATQVNGISTSIRNLVDTITLTCAPVQEYPITVTKNGTVYTGAYTITGVNMKFASSLDAGDYTVNYACLKQQ